MDDIVGYGEQPAYIAKALFFTFFERCFNERMIYSFSLVTLNLTSVTL